MQFNSVIFFVFLLGVVCLYWLIKPASLRHLVLAFANAVFIYSFLDHWTDGWALAGFMLIGYVMVASVPLRKPGVAGAYVLVLVTIFALLKQYFVPENLVSAYPVFSTLGLSYVLFRILQLIIDRAQGMIETLPSPLRFFSYVAFFPAFLSGPIHRFENFDQQVQARTGTTDFFSERMLLGLVKVLILAPALQQVFFLMSNGVYPGQTEAGLIGAHYRQALPFAMQAGLAAAAYVFYLYFNFSGYSDIAISAGRLFGIVLPENFNRPFLATNVSDFWNRWHMSLSEWIKAYMFNPLLLRFLAWFPDRSQANFVSFTVLFTVFFTIGVWHGSTLVYVYFGAYLGGAAVLHKSYQLVMLHLLGRKSVKMLNSNLAYGYFCRGLTFAYFALGLMCFTMNAAQLVELLSKVGLFAGVTVFLSVSVVMAIAISLNKIPTWLSMHAKSWIPKVVSPLWFSQARVSLYTIIILLFGTLFGTPSGFVYQVY